MSSFSTALSALTAASTAVDSVSHNLANLNTAGYKTADITFQEMIAGASGSGDTGAGVSVAAIARKFVQGPIEMTGGQLDAAIQGSGFFIVKPGSTAQEGETLFTRTGRFHVGPTGALLTASGDRVQGWNINTATDSIPSDQPIEDILVPIGTRIPPEATTSFTIGANLDAAAADGTVVELPLEIYDAEGNAHIFSVTFTKQSADTWDLALTTSDSAVELPLPAFEPHTLTFVDGQLDPDTENVTIGPLNFTEASGLEPIDELNWDLSSGSSGVGLLTQYSRPSVITSLSQNGRAEATVTDVRIDTGGRVLAIYSDGIESEIGRLALANVRNPETLIAAGHNAYRAAADTFVLQPSEAGSGEAGQIAGGAMEMSNVDLAEQFTRLITYQRNYQANARSITTTDEMMQETLSLKR